MSSTYIVRQVALADPEQSIYGFTGADPNRRINDYREFANPQEFNFADANHRSTETDIVEFGKDVLKGEFRNSVWYEGIKIIDYKPNKNQAFHALKGKIRSARRRLTQQKPEDWSLAVLTPTKKLMEQVSDKLSQSDPEIIHHVSIDIEEAMLAMEILAFLLQPASSEGDIHEFLDLLRNFFYGKGGNDIPTQTAMKEAQKIERAAKKAVEYKNTGKNLPQNSIVHPISNSYQECRDIKFLGDPEKDWLSVRNILQDSGCRRLREVAEKARNIRILGRGTQLRKALSQAWRETEAYTDALDIVRKSFTQEHFARSRKPETGIVVMNMHKAKGHQFDEVIIFEGWPRRTGDAIVSNPDRVVRGNIRNNGSYHAAQARENLYVSITRSKLRTTIMTPKNDRCILLPRRY